MVALIKVTSMLAGEPMDFVYDGSLDNPVTFSDNVVLRWNRAALGAVRLTHPGPPIVARALAVLHTCIFDAWSAYDPHALATTTAGRTRRPQAEWTEANKVEAICYAAYTALADLFPSAKALFEEVMAALKLDSTRINSGGATPADVGLAAAAAVLAVRHADGSNQLGDRGMPAYSDYTGYASRNTPQAIADPDHWQPLFIPATGATQVYIAPHWGLVTPFALTSPDQFQPRVAPAKHADAAYGAEVAKVIDYTADLDERQKAIAEYWADGPNSELPPGHWCLFAQFVLRRDRHGLDTDVYMFFAMTNAVLDGSIAGWGAKRTWDSVRPVTAVHFLHAGRQVRYWTPAGQAPGRTIDGAQWQPYQAASVVTPPFPEFYSGHSVFSAAAAEVLQSFKGSDVLGAMTKIPAFGSRVELNASPLQDVILSWNTFSDAADEAGLSRRYGGIHFVDGDLAGREIGRLIGAQAWRKAQGLFRPQDQEIAQI